MKKSNDRSRGVHRAVEEVRLNMKKIIGKRSIRIIANSGSRLTLKYETIRVLSQQVLRDAMGAAGSTAIFVCTSSIHCKTV